MESDDEVLKRDINPVNKEKDDDKYPPKPIKPLESDCCGSGCATCVFDLYELELKRWQQRCDDIDQGLPFSKDIEILSIYDYKSFAITNIEILTDTIKIFTFGIPSNGRLPLSCGQHIVARSFTDDGKMIIRPYTPISKRTERGYFKIAIKLYENGVMSRCIKNWEIGSKIEWRGSFGDFRYQVNEFDFILMIAGGTGVTPMLQVIREVLHNDDDYTKLHLFYSVPNADDIIMKEDLKEWNSYWNFNVCYCLSGSNTNMGKMSYGDTIYEGRINSDCLKTYLSNIPSNCKVLICGSRSFSKDMLCLVTDVYTCSANQIFCF